LHSSRLQKRKKKENERTGVRLSSLYVPEFETSQRKKPASESKWEERRKSRRRLRVG